MTKIPWTADSSESVFCSQSINQAEPLYLPCEIGASCFHPIFIEKCNLLHDFVQFD